ncbi:DUF5455 family protein [Thiobacillus sp.]|uniref:DUF5455 family protein n=1 Tax=Thiobacillus sp. TaxID=924 RepID=UPI001ACAB6CB|nr:DUF5455 family protein [Thiobacillus sp.]MBN8781353.1 DUF5455 family protein [Thiobacillus sp.]
MPLITFLASLLGSLAGFFGKWMTKKLAIATAAVALFATMTLAMVVALSALISGINAAVPATICQLTSLIPDNGPAVLSAVISAKLIRFTYDWHTENLRLMSYIT